MMMIVIFFSYKFNNTYMVHVCGYSQERKNKNKIKNVVVIGNIIKLKIIINAK